MATTRFDVAPVRERPSAEADVALLEEVVVRLEAECPRRESASAEELHAQEILGDELAARGLEVELFPFRYSPSLYLVLVVHYGVAMLGSALYLWQPWLAATLHLLAAVSYALDCHYRGFWLRRCVPWRTSHNLTARIPAAAAPRKRIVLIAHADAAPTGWMFSPTFLKFVHAPWPNSACLLRKQMLASTAALLLLMTLDIIRATTGYWFPWMYYGFTLGSVIPFILLAQIAWFNRTVPGANDNLTGCAALVLLAERFTARPLPGVELVFVATGCEEAGRGGAWTLERKMRGIWNPQTTTIIGLDTLSGGQLRYHVEGEMIPLFPTRHLRDRIAEVAATDERFAGVAPYHAPAGATDVAPFVCRGYDGLCVTRINPQSDIPSDYHVPSDHSANLNYGEVLAAVDFAEQLARQIGAAR